MDPRQHFAAIPQMKARFMEKDQDFQDFIGGLFEKWKETKSVEDLPELNALSQTEIRCIRKLARLAEDEADERALRVIFRWMTSEERAMGMVAAGAFFAFLLRLWAIFKWAYSGPGFFLVATLVVLVSGLDPWGLFEWLKNLR